MDTLKTSLTDTDYDIIVRPRLAEYPSIKLLYSDNSALDVCIFKIMLRKPKYVSDNYKKRWKTGLGGEMALGKYLNEPFVNLNPKRGPFYVDATLNKLGLDVDITTAEVGKFPIIRKRPKYPSIIVIRAENYYYIAGLATADILDKYQLKQVDANGKTIKEAKPVFYGFEHLIPFKDKDELKKIIKG